MKQAITILNLCCIVLLGACANKNIQPTGNIIVLGKGGMGTFDLYPMNSYESLLAALALNPGGLEIDVHLSKDNVLVAYHSSTLEAETNLKGIVRENDWKDIAKGHYTVAPYMQHTIVSIDTLLAQNESVQQLTISLDCKISQGKTEDKQLYFNDFANAVIYLQEKYPSMKSNMIVESTEIDLLKLLKSIDERIVCYYNHSDFGTAIHTAMLWQIDGIIMKDEDISSEQVQASQEHGIKVQIWESGWRNYNEALAKKPDYFQTISLKKVLGK